MDLDNDTVSDHSPTSMRAPTPNKRPFSNLSMPWTFMGRQCPRSEIVFFSQMTIIVCVIVASIYNLSTSHKDRSLWITLLSSSLGYVLPNPSIERRQTTTRL